ncbi:MAG: excinuclease ABC subunit UvrC [Cyclobacteriaceae bacterium]|nr:excinuclease ABC subunit UvrC [Cyclobacteriaceae bacterium HetDA_MAG_MS6]
MQFHRIQKSEYRTLPTEPGIYKFFDKEKIIYVGKAKNLKNRVSSYFSNTNQSNYKTTKLIREVVYIEITIVNSEFDALLLENSLIKENQPKYNILLKDDKSFPSICITHERFPRIYSTRRIDKSKGQYFGPYTSVKAMNSVLDLIRKLYKIRTCNYLLSEDNIRKKKFKVCLEYHIGNCLAPCEGLQREHEYLEEIDQAKKILQGDIPLVKSHFKTEMDHASKDLNFELAHEYKIKLDYLEKFQVRSLIVSQKITDTDVFAILVEDKIAFVNYLKIQMGSIRVSETVEVKRRLDESEKDILSYSIIELRQKYESDNKTILTNIPIGDWPHLDTYVPKIGDKKKLVDLSVKNALYSKKEKTTKNAGTPNERILTQLQEDLHLKELPVHIECFDNSNFQGSSPVASMVCFKNAKPSKKDYRKFNIKTVEGPDDFSSMKEIVGRRYYKLKTEGLPLPNLIVIDGGKGQLSAASEALRALDLYGSIPIIGIAKKLEEIYTPSDSIPLYINKKSESLKLIQRLRDEAHRFAITFHRQKRSKKSIGSVLDNIPGIGPSSKEKLLSHFKSVERIKKTSPEELAQFLGPSKAKLIDKYFSS